MAALFLPGQRILLVPLVGDDYIGTAMSAADPILVARGAGSDCFLLPPMANRHGLIAGATGTGKTVTLQLLAEQFSRRGVPVFMADIKGDLSGLCRPGGTHPKIVERAKQLKLEDFAPMAHPVTFWDVFGEQGHPVRATISEMGPLLLSRLLQLNETQEGVLHLVFKIADENGLLLLDLKDLRAVLQYAAEHANEFNTQYGRISAASVGTIQRALMTLEQQGAEKFFGEPALNLDDLIQTDTQGRGVINIVAADKLMSSPRVYSTFLLWLLSELFENLPEVGDQPKPKLVFFFDEAHLLFSDIPPSLLEKIQQVVRLVRSKGVGVYFVTQNPRDIPDVVLGQLGNRVQHALRAFTPRDQKAIKAAAETFRPNPKLDTEAVLTQLGVGEALVSFLDEKGQPSVVERAFVCPPAAQVGPVTPQQRQEVVNSSVVAGVYEKVVDRESAYERLNAAYAAAGQARPGTTPAATPGAGAGSESGGVGGFFSRLFGGGNDAPATPAAPTLPGLGAPKAGSGGRQPPSLMDYMAKTVIRSVTSRVTGEITRGIMGSLFGGTKRRR